MKKTRIASPDPTLNRRCGTGRRRARIQRLAQVASCVAKPEAQAARLLAAPVRICGQTGPPSKAAAPGCEAAEVLEYSFRNSGRRCAVSYLTGDERAPEWWENQYGPVSV